MIGVAAEDFRWVSGRDEVESFEAPVVEHPPGYRSAFCRHCGSPMPVADPDDDRFEVAAGLLDDAPGLSQDRHIFVDFKAPWYDITDGIEQMSRRELIKMRISEMKRRKEAE
jgi:hypothetical protein